MPSLNPLVRETNVLEGTPLNGGTTPLPIRAVADLTKRYVTSGAGWGFVQNYARTLPHYIDDLTRDLKLTLYREMRQDSTLEAAYQIRIRAILEHGYTLVPNLNKLDAGYDQSKAMADFANTALSQLEDPFVVTLQEVCGALIYGNKVAEIDYEEQDWADGHGPYLIPARIRPLPMTAVGFVVDAYKRLLGLVALRPGAVNPTIDMIQRAPDYWVDPQTGGTVDMNRYPLIAREKFLIATYGMENGDWRGHSIFRSAYHHYWFKGQIYLAWKAALARFGSPSVIVYTDPEADPPSKLENGEWVADERTAEQVAATEAEKIKSGASAGMPGGGRVELLEAHNTGDPFHQAIVHENSALVNAVLFQTLMTGDSKHMARAAGEVHQDVFGIGIRPDKLWLAGTVRRDLIRPLIRYNFGPEAERRFTPKFALGQGDTHDFNSKATGVSALLREGFYAPSQYAALDDFMNGPPRDPEEWQQIIEAIMRLVNDPASAVGADVQKLIPRTIGKRVAAQVAGRTPGGP